MSDLRLVMSGGGADLEVLAGDLMTDDGLETQIIVSLFTDKRLPDDMSVPEGFDRRGWWGDALNAEPGDETGSLLWLLQREKLTAAVVSQARRYCEQALAWLVKDGVAESVSVATEVHRPDALLISVTIQRPRKPPLRYQYQAPWGAQSSRN
ncbi:phage GP46 family protein [Endozoicomonas sp. ALB115]|uniref:phage GP46 family protein n=1 Tax=Endozoicomonas sp. ALB115 TaxID=3403074 RepID=UPI003BB64345